MKKIYFAVVSLLATVLLTTSCSNDDIEVNTVGRKHTLSVNIETKGIYEKFGIDSKIFNDFLRPNTQNIGVKTLVYNEEGNLIKEENSHEPTYNNVTHSFDLEEGKRYTIITIETLVSPDNRYQSETWDLLDNQKISSLKLKPKVNVTPSIFDVVGVNTTELMFTKDESLNITPKAIGSQILFFPFNFKNAYARINEEGNLVDEGGYLDKITELSLGTYSKLDYYSLNPSLNDKDRFVKKLTSDGEFKDISSLNASESDDYYGYGYVLDSEVELIFWVHSEGMGEGYYWPTNSISSPIENGKTYFAGYCYLAPTELTERGATAGMFDDYNKLNEWVQKVKPIDGLYREPYTTWGANVTTVQSYMSAYTFGNGVTTDDGYVLWYYGKDREDEIDYYFESSTGGLKDVYVFLDSEDVGDDELQKFFDDMGYTLLVSGSSYLIYKKDEQTNVYVGINNQNYWVVRYYNSTSSVKEYTSPLNTCVFAQKKDASRQPSQVGIDKSVVKSKLMKCESTFSGKKNE